MTLPRISLAQQIEAQRLAITRQRSLANGATVKGLRPRSVEEYDAGRLAEGLRSLEWLQENEADIRTWVASRSGGRP